MAYQAIRLRDLEKAITGIRSGQTKNTRPAHGWLRAVREALSLTLDEVAKTARMPRQHVGRFEKYEATEKITLASLRRVAEAMDCELVYVVAPKSGTYEDLAARIAREKSVRLKAQQEGIAREQATKLVHDVAHTMALEGQHTGRTNERIEEETQRILNRRRSRSSK